MEPSRLHETAETCKTNTLVKKSPKHRDMYTNNHVIRAPEHAEKEQFTAKSMRVRGIRSVSIATSEVSMT